MTDVDAGPVLSGRTPFGLLSAGNGQFWPDTPAGLARLAEAVPETDRRTVRQLARQVAELAADPANAERAARGRAANSLQPGRPLVWLDEVPWHEFAGADLDLSCQSGLAREVEEVLRRVIYRWRHFPADVYVEPFFRVGKAVDETGIGLAVTDDILATDPGNPVVSHHYVDQLPHEAALDKTREPVATARPDIDAAICAAVSELLGGELPVELHGHQVYAPTWDDISALRGIENCLIDLLDRPDFTHSIVARLSHYTDVRMTQFEAQGLLDFDLANIHSTPPWADGLPAAGFSGDVRLQDVWYRSMAQLFVSASPAMRDEFDLQYARPLMARCGLVYYGCCEPLDTCMEYLRTIPNLRKIGATPWANIPSLCEQSGPDYVLSHKPNPAHVAMRFDPAVVEAEITQVVEACLEYGCPYEIVLKDISTVGGNPDNLTSWTTLVESVLDRYY
ncbi:MAG: hypothetical protein LBR58_02525 [Propionibacteriaceae bacterium]|nr:hypothetical protein [Propionibacteriaceae bacterium]